MTCRLALSLAVASVLTACASAPSAPRPVETGSWVHVQKRSPDVRWKQETLLSLDMDGDGKPDEAMLGTIGLQAVVDVVLGGDPIPWELRLAQGNAQDSLCGPPDAVRMRVEACGPEDDLFVCRPAPGAAPGASLQVIRLDSGECDGFHLYFDGKQVRWARR